MLLIIKGNLNMNNTTTKIITRTRTDYSSKLKKLEEEKQQLILQRKEEIFTIIDKIGCLSIDNELLSGALAVLKEIDGKLVQDLSDDLKTFEALIRERSPIFFRRKSKSSEPKAKLKSKQNQGLFSNDNDAD